jgi:hypothetical protein
MSESGERKWNPRFVAYAMAHGRTPEEQLAHDEVAWPGGKMCGFLLWSSRKIEAWRASLPAGTDMRGRQPVGPEMHAAYDAWLEGAR